MLFQDSKSIRVSGRSKRSQVDIARYPYMQP